MKRGIWRCWKCKRHWVYNVEDRVESLDKICHGCGRRNRATIFRRPGLRGRKAKALVFCRPSYMPLHALQEEVKRRNAAMARPRKREGFTRASELEEFRVRKDE
jgi:hypothetical protein